ncbi:MAG TPA: hypothetical protein PKK31_11750, partial [Elusimicrobiales bacterium]|nr:hypothetical protein [Elusimicrobiales bacterium]
RLFARGWTEKKEKRVYYLAGPAGHCADNPPGTRKFYFSPYDVSAARSGPRTWPPPETERFINLRGLGGMPEEYRRFLPRP